MGMDELLSPRTSYIAALTAATYAVAGAAYVVVRSVPAFKEKPFIAAVNIAHYLPIILLCYYGLQRMDLVFQRPATLHERMYGFDDSAEQICLIQQSLQIFVTSIAVMTRDPALLKLELLGHHLVTFALMGLCLHPFAHSYVGIFFGLTELSTIPLNVLDTFKQFKELRQTYPLCDVLSKVSFTLSFLVLRVGLTVPVSYAFQRDLLELLTSGAAHSRPAVIFTSIANLFVVGLQLFWATLIFKGLRKMLAGGKKGEGAKRK